MNRKLFTFAFIIICFLLLFNCENIDTSFSYRDLNENELKINDTVIANDSNILDSSVRGSASSSKTLTYTVYESQYGKVLFTIVHTGSYLKKGNIFYTNGSWYFSTLKVTDVTYEGSGGKIIVDYSLSGTNLYIEVKLERYGSTQSFPYSYRLLKDTGPIITLYPPKKWTNQSPAKVYIEAWDSLNGVIENSVMYRIEEEGTWKYPEEQLYENEWAAYVTREGLSNITVKAKDKWGIESTKSAQVWLDSKGPSITFDPYKLWWWNPTAVSVYIYAEDYHSRVDDDSALYRIDNGVWKQPEQVYDDEWEILITKRGTSILTFKLRDNAGNWSTVTEEIHN